MIHGKLRALVVMPRPAASSDTDMTLSQAFTPGA
jgi:hypothetical protein